MGGRESLYIGMKCCDKIGYIGGGAPAPGIFPTKDQFMDHPGVMSKDEIRIDPPYSPYLLLIAGGTSDTMVNDFPEQYHKLFTEHGTENIFLPVPGGGHDSSTVIPGNGTTDCIRCSTSASDASFPRTTSATSASGSWSAGRTTPRTPNPCT